MNKEEILYELHHNGKLLLLPNIWSPVGAILLEKMGFPAVATSSATVAVSNGYQDGENMPFEDVLFVLKGIVRSVSVPVTADIESGYAGSDLNRLKDNIKKLLDTGISGINFEDSYHGKPGMVSIDEQKKKLEVIRKTSSDAGIKLFVNARVDVYIRRDDLNDAQKLEEAITRGRAYKECGADALYPIILKNQQHIEALIKEVGLPLNITYFPGIPDLQTLENIGVARVSLASGYIRPALGAMKETAEKLLNRKGMDEVMEGWMPADYFGELIKR